MKIGTGMGMGISSNTFRFDVLVEPSGDLAHDHINGSIIRNGLRKVFSPDGFFLEEEGDRVCFSPIVKILPFSQGLGFSIILISSFYSGVERFFYEMISKWLVPGKRQRLSSFSYSNFSFSSKPLQRFSYCEARFFCQDILECDMILRAFSQIESEIELGALSLYQGNRILDLKGQFSSEKNSLIQERISALIHRRPKDFDYDVFGQMQHFLVGCGEGFKEIREPTHLSRIVYVFYLFKKVLKKNTETDREKRHISFKVSQVRLHTPFGIKKVMGIFLGLNFLKSHEIFEERHLIKALKDHLEEIRVVDGSQFMYFQKEERLHILYLEIEKENGREFSFEEVLYLRNRFPGALENQIEKLMPVVFMPRNEEEVMKNILILSLQLKYIKDLPQAFISFEEQSDSELTFTVILLRVLPSEQGISVREMFKKNSTGFSFVEDRVKKLGVIRKKYWKEATVFRLRVLKSLYMRKDHSVDLLKARQDVVKEIQQTVGEFRDYNGGMIANQVDNLYAFKRLFLSFEAKDDLEIENFFHSIFPVEMRSVIDPFLLKILYGLLEECEKKMSGLEVRLEKGSVIFLVSFVDEVIGDRYSMFVRNLGLRSSQSLVVSSKKRGRSYLGYILLGLRSEEAVNFVNDLQKSEEHLQCSITFNS